MYNKYTTPIHHGKSKYQRAENYKLRLAQAFVSDSGKSEEYIYGLKTPSRKGPASKASKKDWQSFRNLLELKAVGIKLEPNKSSGLRDIRFNRKCNFYPGTLCLPLLTVDDSTGPKFLNLIAFEMCPDFENNYGVTSYISFLDSLIDEANDVIELRKVHILGNLLGSDQEVAQLFNEIGRDLVPNLEIYSQ
uniref:Uncharacterized protein n=1 Tax=Fagus sylvatica TaxID=28930 RepID=A0A2N9GFX4_FAGSY